MNKYQRALDYLDEAFKVITQQFTNDISKVKIYKAERKAIKTLQELVDKATPKEPIEDTTHPIGTYYCPNCQKEFDMLQWHDEYCSICGQRIDWSDEE